MRHAPLRLALGIGIPALAVAVALLASRQRSRVTEEVAARVAAAALGPRVKVVAVEAAGPTRRITVLGDVHALRQVTLYAKVSGYLRAIHVDKGDRVSRGQVLAVVDSPETDDQMLSAQVNRAVKSQVEGRYRALVGKGVVSQLDMDRAAADLQVANAESERMHALVGYELVKAPFAGLISARYVDPGALVPAATGSTQSAQPIVDLVDATTVRIYVYLGQAEAPFVKVGDPVHLFGVDDARVDREARITRLSGALDPRSRTMLTEIDVVNADGLLFPGTFVRVSLDVRADGALRIPTDAVIIRGGEPHVAVVADGHVHFRAVELAGNDGNQIRVHRGLQGGEQVALHVGDLLEDGAPVQAVAAP